jgi:hypothetical protein
MQACSDGEDGRSFSTSSEKMAPTWPKMSGFVCMQKQQIGASIARSREKQASKQSGYIVLHDLRQVRSGWKLRHIAYNYKKADSATLKGFSHRSPAIISTPRHHPRTPRQRHPHSLSTRPPPWPSRLDSRKAKIRITVQQNLIPLTRRRRHRPSVYGGAAESSRTHTRVPARVDTALRHGSEI